MNEQKIGDAVARLTAWGEEQIKTITGFMAETKKTAIREYLKTHGREIVVVALGDDANKE